MQKRDWFVSLSLFVLIFSVSELVSSNHLTGRDISAIQPPNESNKTHLECVNQACVPVNGNGTDLCQTNAQCVNDTNRTDYVQTVRANRTIQINLTHTECINQACVIVNGTGTNQCQTDTDCTHLICINNACTSAPINVTGQSCVTTADCLNQTNLTGGDELQPQPEKPDLPLAPPPAPVQEQPRTLFKLILSWFGI